jgi:hypothetical protein
MPGAYGFCEGAGAGAAGGVAGGDAGGVVGAVFSVAGGVVAGGAVFSSELIESAGLSVAVVSVFF